jgi:hypothetical protein
MIARRISSIYLYDNGIESAIKVRMNSTGQSIKWLLLSEEIDCIAADVEF